MYYVDVGIALPSGFSGDGESTSKYFPGVILHSFIVLLLMLQHLSLFRFIFLFSLTK